MAREKDKDLDKSKEQPDISGKLNPEKAKALDSALAQIERQFGKGSVMKMGERGPQVLEVIPTGSVALDNDSSLVVSWSPTGLCSAG